MLSGSARKSARSRGGFRPSNGSPPTTIRAHASTARSKHCASVATKGRVMMTDSNLYMTLAAAGLAAIAMLAYTGLTGWRGWLQLKHEELAARHEAEGDRTLPNASARIDRKSTRLNSSH